jgi:hypothetical protein
MWTVATAFVLAVCIKGWKRKLPPLDRDDLIRFRRHSEEKYREWTYPFE